MVADWHSGRGSLAPEMETDQAGILIWCHVRCLLIGRLWNTRTQLIKPENLEIGWEAMSKLPFYWMIKDLAHVLSQGQFARWNDAKLERLLFNLSPSRLFSVVLKQIQSVVLLPRGLQKCGRFKLVGSYWIDSDHSAPELLKLLDSSVQGQFTNRINVIDYQMCAELLCFVFKHSSLDAPSGIC